MAIEWFKSMEGTRHFCSGGLVKDKFLFKDTEDKNFIAAPEMIAIAFSIYEKKNATVAKRIFGDAMNMRLGTKDLNILELSVEIGKRGTTFPKFFCYGGKR